jgi:hypothetical protein
MLEFFALLVLLVLLAGALFLIWLIGSLPGRIARNRGHRQADAVSIGGWCSLLMPLPLWPLVMVWAYLDVGVRPAGSLAQVSDR